MSKAACLSHYMYINVLRLKVDSILDFLGG